MFFINKEIEFEQVNGNTKRKVLAHNGSLMCVEVYFDKITESVELHKHIHEQVTYVLKGKFKFIIGGGEQSEERIVTPGDTLYFKSNVPHGCIVLEEGGMVLDVFTPQREDFLK